LQQKVQNQTAIEAGTYEVILSFSNLFQNTCPSFEGQKQGRPHFMGEKAVRKPE
jgi:hypothetical protein